MATVVELEKNFKCLIEKDALSHGYIFFGEALNTALLLTKRIASMLEHEGGVVSEDRLIDTLVVEGESAGIDAVREMTLFLWQKPVVSKRKTLIVHEAHLLTLPAEHALLKLAEEPPHEALILFTSTSVEGLIQPLASRFQKVFVSIPEGYYEERVKSMKPESIEGAQLLLESQGGMARKDVLKEMIENETDMPEIMFLLMYSFGKNKKKNWRVLKALSYRWMRMNEFNTNKRLQLEVALNAMES